MNDEETTGPFSPDSQAFEDRLRLLKPDAGQLSESRLLFEAGRRQALVGMHEGSSWTNTAGVMAATSIVSVVATSLLMLAVGPSATLEPDRVTTADDSRLPLTTEYTAVVSSEHRLGEQRRRWLEEVTTGKMPSIKVDERHLETEHSTDFEHKSTNRERLRELLDQQASRSYHDINLGGTGS